MIKLFTVFEDVQNEKVSFSVSWILYVVCSLIIIDSNLVHSVIPSAVSWSETST